MPKYNDVEKDLVVHKESADNGIRVDDYKVVEKNLVFERTEKIDGKTIYFDKKGGAVAQMLHDHTAVYCYGPSLYGGLRWHLVRRENLKQSGVFKVFY